MENKDLDTMNQEVSDEDIENVLKVLEEFGGSAEGRLKVNVAEEQTGGTTSKKYHYGRCDVGSPFAKGTPFDVSDSCE